MSALINSADIPFHLFLLDILYIKFDSNISIACYYVALITAQLYKYIALTGVEPERLCNGHPDKALSNNGYLYYLFCIPILNMRLILNNIYI
jgi:hypothetical protein